MNNSSRFPCVCVCVCERHNTLFIFSCLYCLLIISSVAAADNPPLPSSFWFVSAVSGRAAWVWQLRILHRPACSQHVCFACRVFLTSLSSSCSAPCFQPSSRRSSCGLFWWRCGRTSCHCGGCVSWWLWRCACAAAPSCPPPTLWWRDTRRTHDGNQRETCM